MLPIATHEFGHSLGLGHSRDETAIMYALYFGSNPVVKLQPDDIAGIQYLYGKSLDMASVQIELKLMKRRRGKMTKK